MSDAFWIGLFGLFGTIATVIVSLINGRKLNTVHTLVNSKMTSALQEIERLKSVVEQLQQGR
jgi:hypothetical protein